MANKKKKDLTVGKDSNGNKIKRGDKCIFWNDENPSHKPIYEFYEVYHRDNNLYISIDREDNNDLSWWGNCILTELEDKETEQ